MISDKCENVVNNSQTLLDSMGDGVIIVDEGGKIIRVNRAVEDILGFNPKDITGRPCLKILSALDARGNVINKKTAGIFQSIKCGKKVSNAIRQFKKNDNNRIWVSITTTPLISSTRQVCGGIIVFRDITEQKTEEEYHSDFAHMASHNLRSPLSNVLWAVESIIAGKLGRVPRRIKSYINDVYLSLKEMNRLVNDFLDITRLRNKKIKPRAKKLSVEKTISLVVGSLAYYSMTQNVKINLKNSSANHYVYFDEDHLQTILQNVIENAIRYSFTKSEIQLEVKKQKGRVVFICSNRGIGIPNNQKIYIFAKSFRAPNAIKKQNSGTGLGLYVTKKMIELNGGEVWFDSDTNDTTTFFVKFR